MKKFLLGSVLGLAIMVSRLAMATPSGEFTLHNYSTNYCLGVAAANPNPGAALVAWPCNVNSSGQNIDPSQWWNRPSPHGQTLTNSTEYLLSGLSGYAIGVQANVIRNGTPLIQWSQISEYNGQGAIVPAGVNQQWGFIPTTTDYYGNTCYYVYNAATDAAGTFYVMGVSGGSTSKGAAVVIWAQLKNSSGQPDYIHHPDQLWCISYQ